MSTKLPQEWVLYVGTGCPYCAKVTNFLKQHSLSLTIVDTWLDTAAAEQLYIWTQRKTVPYLRMADTGMHESDDIITRIASECSLTSE